MDLTFPQTRALRTIAEAGEGLASVYVHRGLMRPGHTNLGVVRRLQKRGLVVFKGELYRLTRAGRARLGARPVRNR